MLVFAAIVRMLVFATFVFSAALALGSWAVTTRRINPFGRPARLIRSVSDPVLVPIERWLLRRGGNPQNAPWWLLGVSIAGGIVIISLTQWAAVALIRAGSAVQSGPRGTLRLIVYYAGQLVIIALIVRVIGTWIGKGRFTPWLRWAYLLTDWIVEPLRKIIPPFGMIDVTPIVAWLLLQVLLGFVMRAI